jgi:ribonuclease P protein component
LEYPKSARIRFRSEFLKFFTGSEVKRLGVCTLFKLPGAEGASARLGITVKARVNSVERNRLKRQIRESFRLNRGHLGVSDYNVVVPSGVRITWKTPRILRKQLDACWTDENPF